MKLDRMIGILSVLLQRDSVTAPELAKKFEVSRRTINRDVESLCRAGIPIVTRQGAGGGMSIMEGYRVDRALLSWADLRSILAGLRSLDSVSGSRRYAQLMEKLSAEAPDVLRGDDCVLIDLASWYREPLSEKIDRIRAAIDDARVIAFRYYAPSGESVRCVEPCFLVFHWANWYVYGWCRERQDWRLFKLNRIAELRLGEGFRRRVAPYPDLSTPRVFPRRYHARVLVEPVYRWRIIEEYGPECYAEQPDGRLLFEGWFADRNHLVTWVLSFEDGAELLEPVELRENLLKIGKALQEKYEVGG